MTTCWPRCRQTGCPCDGARDGSTLFWMERVWVGRAGLIATPNEAFGRRTFKPEAPQQGLAKLYLGGTNHALQPSFCWPRSPVPMGWQTM
ncbi:unnamed protein product [Protopolystoma xenopodis]|uniref:Uncharacterized protein n=1 Tax=Protopolystoma xenopodis TaxID=117903 RepID=A0A3S5AUT2_9PLAT|nr:unnamed protein product [Protopolystoma xenopodis]